MKFRNSTFKHSLFPNSIISVNDNHSKHTHQSNSQSIKKSKNLFPFVPIIIITSDQKWLDAALIGKNVFIMDNEIELKTEDYLNIICESKGEYYIEVAFIKDNILYEGFNDCQTFININNQNTETTNENNNKYNNIKSNIINNTKNSDTNKHTKYNIVVLEQKLGKPYDKKRTLNKSASINRDILCTYLSDQKIRKGKITNNL